MRIALVSTYPPSKGSLNEYAFHFVEHLRHKPEVKEIVLLVDELPNGQGYPASSGDDVPIRIVPCWRFGSINNATRIRQAVQTVKPDVVLFNIQFATFSDKRVSGALGLLSPLLIRQAGYTTIVLLHNIMETIDLKKAGFGSNPILEWITRTAGNIFTRMILSANLVALTIPKYVEILEQKYHATNVFLAPHGAFTATPPPSLDLPAGPLQIMTFGKFGTYKKVDKLIEAFDLLQKRCTQSLELVIAGTDSPNSQGYLEQVQETYKRVPNIRYTGYVAEDDVPKIFSNAAVVVFPYNSTTGSSGVLHQAGNYGRAVVLPHFGDFAELISEEGYVGEFFEPENSHSMADAIERLLINPEYRRESGMKNYTAAVGLPMSDVVDWYLLHFERLLNEQSH